MRNPSPASAITLPLSNDWPVGCASNNTTNAHRNPSGTRSRARRRVRSGTTTFCSGEPPFNGGEYFGDFDIHQAHLVHFALAKMMTLTHRRARYRLIVGQPRTVAFRSRRTV